MIYFYGWDKFTKDSSLIEYQRGNDPSNCYHGWDCQPLVSVILRVKTIQMHELSQNYMHVQKVFGKISFLYLLEKHCHTSWTILKIIKRTFKLVLFIVLKISSITYFLKQPFPNDSIFTGMHLYKFQNKGNKMTLFLWEVKSIRKVPTFSWLQSLKLQIHQDFH